MCENLVVRNVIKQGNGVPTIPVSTSHQNGDWLTTDIYEGEQYQDLDTGIVYTRFGNDIQTVGGGQGNVRIWKAQITQAGTNAPVLTVLVNTLGVTVTTSYSAVGEYLLNGFASNLTGLTAVEWNATTLTGYTVLQYVGDSVLGVFTVDSSVTPTNGILDPGNPLTQIITVTKYD